jgi:YVTN family beta-propeller protein
MEHGNRDLVMMSAWTLAYYYQQPTARAVLSDVLDVGKSASESSHSYTINNATWSGAQGFTYDGVMDAYGLVDDGRSNRGYSRFQMAINSSNDGVLLRRRLDYGTGNQKGAVYIDGQYVGIWYTAGSNPNHRWRDDDFLIPGIYTSGKSSITVQLVSATPSVDWTEFMYSAYSLVNPATPPVTPTLTPTGIPTASSTAIPTSSSTPISTMTPTNTPLATLTASPIPISTLLPTPAACVSPSIVASVPVGAGPKGIAVDLQSNRVYVSLFDDSSIAVVDAKTNQTIAIWNTRSRAHANGIAVTGSRVFVALRESASVAILDAATGSLIGSTAVGGMPYGVGAANNRVWVANFAAGSVSVLDATTRNVVATTNVGNDPSFVVPDGTRAFVSYYGGGIAIIGSDGTLMKRFDPLGTGAFGIALNATTNRLYVTNREERVLWVVDTVSGLIVKGTALSPAPYALALNPITNRLFIVLADSNQVDVRDATTLQRVAILPVGAQGDQGGDGIAVANGRVYVANNAEGTLTVITDICK